MPCVTSKTARAARRPAPPTTVLQSLDASTGEALACTFIQATAEEVDAAA
ncbi:hypothetical protein, partial [Pseudomonas qingdaonensis]